MKIIDRIIELNNERSWTEYKLAKEAGISQSTLTNLISRDSNPSLTTLIKVSNAFGITLAQFFDMNDEVPDLTEEQKEMLKRWNKLSTNQKEKVNIYISGMLEE